MEDSYVGSSQMTEIRREYDEFFFHDYLRDDRLEEAFPEALPEEIWLNIKERIPARKTNNTKIRR